MPTGWRVGRHAGKAEEPKGWAAAMVETIIYTDASCTPDRTVLACIYTRNGSVAKCWRRVIRPSMKPTDAEAAAVAVARFLWPQAEVRTDLKMLDDGEKVRWVPRAENRIADEHSRYERDLTYATRSRKRRGGCWAAAIARNERAIDTVIRRAVERDH